LFDPAPNEESPTETVETARETAANQLRVRYPDDAQAHRQPPITCLIPTRPMWWTGAIALAFCVLTGLQALYGWVAVYRPDLPSWQALQPNAAGSLASWFGSALLLCGAVYCCLIYLLRRHRMDDYRGGYRYWVWAAGLLVIASIDTSTGLHQVVADLNLAGGRYWWLVGWGSLSTFLVFVLGVETFSSRTAGAFLAISLAGYIAAAAFQLEGAATSTLHVMLESTIVHGSHAFLVAALGLYARFVLLDAHGMVQREAADDAEEQPSRTSRKPRRQKQAKRQEPDSQEDSAQRVGDRRRRDNDRGAQPKRIAGERNATDPADEVAEMLESESEPAPKLSKAERKRLRKQKRRAA
jgi:hypothetical protein